ncbi:TetR/AcrR family transcriptional regulator [Nocardiopsis sp. ARC36]
MVVASTRVVKPHPVRPRLAGAHREPVDRHAPGRLHPPLPGRRRGRGRTGTEGRPHPGRRGGAAGGLGRRKITVEDVARRAKVGKGTVYLHFATKETLLLAVVMRAQLGLMRQVLEVVGRSPDNVRPSEVARSLYLNHLDSPLMRAVLTGGTESLGALSRDAAALVGGRSASARGP